MPTPTDDVVLRLPQVMARVGLSKSSIYAMVAAGTFPQPCSIGVRTKAWLQSEIADFINRCANRRSLPKKVAA
ncbi:MAG TPA: AlpA family transcriptional regulator [Casimicrobiaceae bacterium]|nr:AlpA family transcriptional regulator [Casimicrobiaceae bacterium]